MVPLGEPEPGAELRVIVGRIALRRD